MPKKKILTELSPAQIELMETKKNEWIDFALFNGDEIDQQACYDGIDFLYGLTELEKPIKIVVDSPLAVQYAIPYAKALLEALKQNKGDYSQVRSQVDSQVDSQVFSQVDSQVYSQVDSQVYSQVRSQVRSQVYSQVYSQVDSQVYSQVRSQVYSQVDSQVRSQVDSQVYSQVDSQVYSQVDSQVRSQVDSQVDSQVRSQVRSPETFAWDTLGFYAGWVSYIEYFKELGIVKHDKWDEYVKYMKSGQFMGVYLDGLAVVCRRPQAVRRDDQLRLHNDQKPAIEWRDGYKLYFLHGQPFEEKLWKRITSQKMTIKEVINMENADERTMAFSMLRPDRLLKGINAELIHTGQRGTRLYKVDDFTKKVLGDSSVTGDTEYCMVMDDASTDRQFLEWVDPKVGSQKDADFAQASAWGIPLEDYLNLGSEA